MREPEQLPGAPRHSAAVRHGDGLAPRQTTASARPGSEVSPPGSLLQHPAPPWGLKLGAGRVLWLACCPPLPRVTRSWHMQQAPELHLPASVLHRAPAGPCTHMPAPSRDIGSGGRAQAGPGHLQPRDIRGAGNVPSPPPHPEGPWYLLPTGGHSLLPQFPHLHSGAMLSEEGRDGSVAGRGCQQGL